MTEQDHVWAGSWSYPIYSLDYRNLEMNYSSALVERFRNIVLPDEQWHHVVIFVDGVKEMDKIVVEWIPTEKPDKYRPLIIGGLLFTFGVAQILIGFASWFLTGETLLASALFLFGFLAGSIGIMTWLYGVLSARKL